VNTTIQPYFPYERGLIMKRGQGVLQAEQNAIEGWHFGLQTLFHHHHPTLWTFVQGIKKIFKCNINRFYKKLLVHNLLPLTWM